MKMSTCREFFSDSNEGKISKELPTDACIDFSSSANGSYDHLLRNQV